MKKHAAAFTAVIAALGLHCHAQQAPRDIFPADPAQLLRDLATLEKKHDDAANSELARRLAILSRGAAGDAEAAQLYEEAVKDLRFEGRKDSARAQAGWSKNNADMLRSEDLRTAARFHLRYLIMALQRGKGQGTPSPELAEASLRYVKELAAAMAGKNLDNPSPEVEHLLRDPIGKSIFTRWLSLNQYLPSSQDWEPVPGDIAGILETNVRGPWRAAHDPRVPETWDLQISLLESTSISEDPLVQGSWKNETLPRLLFARASDKVASGQRNKGIDEMMQLVRTYPLHPDFKQWAGKLRETVQANPSASPAAPSAP